MKSLQEVINNYSDKVKGLEKQRKKAIYFSAFSWIVFMILVLFITFLLIMGFTSNGSMASYMLSLIQWLSKVLPKWIPFQVPLILVLVGVVPLVNKLLRGGISSETNYKFKTKKLIKRIAEFSLQDFLFDRKIRITKAEVKESELFNYTKDTQDYNSIIIADTLSRQYDHTLLKICDLEVYGSVTKQTTSFLMSLPFLNQFFLTIKLLKSLFSNKYMTDTLKNESFKGVFASAIFNKQLKGHTIILPDNIESKIGGVAKIVQSLNFRKEQLVKLEDPSFEKEFVVYSTDQVEARYALSTSMMEKLTSLKNKLDKPLMISFKGYKISIAIANSEGFFGVGKFKQLDDKLIEDIYNQLTNITSIVEELNINNNIWGK